MPIRAWLKTAFAQWSSPVSRRARHGAMSRPTAMPAMIESLELRRLLSVNSVGAEYQVNHSTTGIQTAPQVAMDAQGNYVVAWYGDSGDIFFQRFNANGASQGSPVLVNPRPPAGNTISPDSGVHPSIAMDAAGDFVITWLGANSQNIYAMLYDSAGNAKGNEFVVNSSPGGFGIPSAGMDAAGNFVITWQNLDGIACDIEARRFAASGVAIGNQFDVNPTVAERGFSPQIGMDAAGDFVIAWQKQAGQTGKGEIVARRYSHNGDAQGSLIHVSTNSAFTAGGASVSMNASGGFVIAWTELAYTAPPPLGSGPGTFTSSIVIGPVAPPPQHVEAQIYDKSGNAVGVNFRVNQSGVSASVLSLASDSSGNFVVLWKLSDMFLTGISGQRYDVNGVAQDAPFLVTRSNDSLNYAASDGIAMDAAGNIVVVYTDFSLQQQTSAVFGKNFSFTPPILTIPGTTGSVHFVDGGPPTQVLNTLIVSDSSIGGATLTGATIQITGNYHAGQDRLAFLNTAPVQWSWNEATGTLTLTGSASVAAYQQMLRSVTYQNVANTPNSLPRTISVQGFEGTARSSVVTQSVEIQLIDRHPVIAGVETSALVFTEKNPATAISPGLQVTDPDSNYLYGAKIQITGNYHTGQDRLSFYNTSAVQWNWDASTGTLLLSGKASVSNYRTMLQSVMYQNVSDNPNTLTRTVSFSVTDTLATPAVFNSNVATRNITVKTVVDPPVLSGISSTPLSYVAKSPAVAIAPTLNLYDAKFDNLTSASVKISSGYVAGKDLLSFVNTAKIKGVWNATTGTLTLTGTDTVSHYREALRSITFQTTAVPTTSSTRTVTFLATDTASTSSAATRSISVLKN